MEKWGMGKSVFLIERSHGDKNAAVSGFQKAHGHGVAHYLHWKARYGIILLGVHQGVTFMKRLWSMGKSGFYLADALTRTKARQFLVFKMRMVMAERFISSKFSASIVMEFSKKKLLHCNRVP
jgi:hypothetical protein